MSDYEIPTGNILNTVFFPYVLHYRILEFLAPVGCVFRFHCPVTIYLIKIDSYLLLFYSVLQTCP